jgi:Rps23 Pro-64 3,4-dihydroxylase Tpa1-like proline 4-hydroxylase
MLLVTKNAQFIIFDDFLPHKDFQIVQNYVRDENYQSFDKNCFHPTHNIFDGTPLLGESSAILNQQKSKTITGLELFVEHLSNKTDALDEWIGKKYIDWETFTAKVFLYPQGAGLVWHNDGGTKTGSYAFYTHSRWNVQWGGDLLIPDEPTRNIDYPSSQDSRHEYDTQKNIDIGIGQYIAPKPNRLVVIAAGNPHRINKVEPMAGDNLRSSISGFFVRSKK